MLQIQGERSPRQVSVEILQRVSKWSQIKDREKR